jgi:hypothetical protein
MAEVHMILGMTISVFVHVLLSLIGLVAGFVVLAGLLAAKREDGWTALFLVTTVLTSVTGFFLPAAHLLPSHIVGIISLVVLLVAIVTRYVTHLEGASRWLYAGSAVLALYLNFFVFIAQAFLKVPPLHALAPEGSEPPFVVAQVVALIAFIALGLGAVRKFRPV